MHKLIKMFAYLLIMAFLNIPKNIVIIFESEFESNILLKQFMKKHKLVFIKLLAYGKSSWIILTKDINTNKLFVLKTEKKSSTRTRMVEKEAKYLSLANTKNIGQKLIDYDINARSLLWEYIDALPLKEWIKHANKQQLKKFLKEVFKQAITLDKIGLDHGQIAGDGTNILVKPNSMPVIVDFEKSSDTRKTHNENVLINFFFKNKSEFSNKLEYFGITKP